MRKFITILFAAAAVMFTSCKKDFEPGGTEVEKMAGEWWVTATEMKDGKEVPGTEGDHFRIRTFNTAANVSTEMWVWDSSVDKYQVKVGVDYSNKSFSMADYVEASTDSKRPMKVKITDGKVLMEAAKTPSGMPADSIVYMLQMEGDSKTYKISGFRRTGFPADEF